MDNPREWKRRAASKVGRMNQTQVRVWLDLYISESMGSGPTLFHESVRNLTGGFNSQTINTVVFRMVRDRQSRLVRAAFKKSV